MAFKPNEITKEHVLDAIKKIEKEHLVLKAPTRWEVVINDKKYPPKEVMRYAHEQMNGEKTWNYGGGEGTNKYLKKMGFSFIDMHDDPVKEIIKKYKKHIREGGLKNEIYKWNLLAQFQGRPNTEADDFKNEIESVKFLNLIYPVGQAVIKHLAFDKTTEYRDCFKVLFDESIDLQERINYFDKKTLEIYRELVPQIRFSHHQDERTISTFLTFHNPNEYTFYKDSFYQKYCKLIGITPKKKGEKLVHYLALINDFISDYINDDEELIELVKSNIPQTGFKDENNKILAQDILYQMLDKGIEEIDIENYSVYKISMGDFSNDEMTYFLENNKISVHKDTKAKGISSESQGASFENKMKIGDYFYLTQGNGTNRIKLIGRITSLPSPTTYNDYGDDGWLDRSFEVMATSKNKSQYKSTNKWWTPNNNSTCIEIKKDELAEANKLLFEPYFMTRLFSSQLQQAPTESEKPNFLIKMAEYSINQILYGPPGTGKTFKLQQIIEEWDLKEKIGSTKDYTAFVKDYTWWKIVALALLELGKVRVPDLAKHPLIIAKLGSSSVKSLKTRLWSSLQHHCVDDCENVKLVKRIGEKVFYKEANSDWRLDDVEAFKSEYDALVESFSDFKSSDNTKSKDYTFTTCHQSLSYEDFIEGIKPELNKTDEDELNEKGIVYEIRKGIFYNACEKAAQKAGFINLKDCLDATKEKRKELFDQAISENKIHVIFLDEINRCNVSSVFGELITLIEEDKRLGKENEIADITLPYSQDEFGVPANLFIIGTMNTADRSVEALDTALRRRFSFEEMIPNSKIVEEKVFGDYLRKDIMEKINNRIELLLDRNHTLGHAYFIKQDFKNSFKNEIIPLLQEYFYNDYGKIGLVLGKGFVREKSITVKNDKSIFADFETKNEVDIVKSYELIPFNEVEVEFDIAIQTLLA